MSLLHAGGTVVPEDMGPALLLLLTATGTWHGRSISPPKSCLHVILGQFWDAVRISWVSGISAPSLLG